jgi:hypothetical protein
LGILKTNDEVIMRTLEILIFAGIIVFLMVFAGRMEKSAYQLQQESDRDIQRGMELLQRIN